MWSLKLLCEYQEYSLVFFIMIIVFTIYYVRNMCMPSQSSYVESLKCHYNGIWRYVVVEHLGGHEGGLLMNRISALVRRDLGEMISVFPRKRTQLKVTFVQTRKKILTWTHWLVPKSWIFQLPELWIINVFCLSLPVYDICYSSPNYNMIDTS